jgi:hypothetical protein
VGILKIAIDVPYPAGIFAIADEDLAFLHFRLISVSAII